jgi:hypothetical protein
MPKKCPSSKLPHFWTPILLPPFFSAHCSQLLSNPWQSPVWIHSSNSKLRSTITKKEIEINQGRCPSHLNAFQIRFESIIKGPRACHHPIRDPSRQMPACWAGDPSQQDRHRNTLLSSCQLLCNKNHKKSPCGQLNLANIWKQLQNPLAYSEINEGQTLFDTVKTATKHPIKPH